MVDLPPISGCESPTWLGDPTWVRTPCESVVIIRLWITDNVQPWRRTWTNKVVMTEHWRDRGVIHPGVTLAVGFLDWIRNRKGSVVRQGWGEHLPRVGHCLLISIESRWACREIPHGFDLVNPLSWRVVDRSARNLRRSWLLTLTRYRFFWQSVETGRCHVGKPL